MSGSPEVISDMVESKHIEDALLYLLEAKSATRHTPKKFATRKSHGQDIVMKCVQSPYEYQGPSSTDVVLSDRVLTFNPDLLLGNAIDIIGDSFEYLMETDYGVMWHGVRRVSSPKDFWCVGKAARWFHLEVANIREGGTLDFSAALVFAVDKNGLELLSAKRGFRPQYATNLGRSHRDRGALIAYASAKEDSQRSGTVRVTLSDEIEAHFTVPYGDHLEILSDRDGAFVKNRRKALIHRVCAHARRLRSGNQAPVKEHLRGSTTAIVGGISVVLTPQGLVKERAT